jgi:hypothetical protein
LLLTPPNARDRRARSRPYSSLHLAKFVRMEPNIFQVDPGGPGLIDRVDRGTQHLLGFSMPPATIFHARPPTNAPLVHRFKQSISELLQKAKNIV